MKQVTILRWLARLASIIILLLFAVLFVEDRVPIFLFLADPAHMVALAVMLLGLAVAWKWELAGGAMVLGGYLVDLAIVNIRLGTLSLDMGPLVTVVPIVGIVYLCIGWWTRRVQVAKQEPEHSTQAHRSDSTDT